MSNVDISDISDLINLRALYNIIKDSVEVNASPLQPNEIYNLLKEGNNDSGNNDNGVEEEELSSLEGSIIHVVSGARWTWTNEEVAILLKYVFSRKISCNDLRCSGLNRRTNEGISKKW
ncbi:2398_t:CDS:2, partial [Entrophospora sp. SA101]